ncbi:MAG: hypothetical protein A2233_02435 [Candidatus Kerfeldbacteria bacterium RIFOXYA2_FULL_38_24]|uniref:PpiC domain-containing protein n=1 Tax=Candidatus Kerfeldbacteria bacterium RIFOXYB2_FULL_38_14 TaxID=1798547 RepID=A0A1G2BCA2_9BACT|nr:MAG: hypothetical protein A2233_02435 [Candidatus Kerfeldbacteria bacterium RIFOXYA2_FULL_38_24]OGY85847.1 MAG: hypothetical protein A2319_05835 [Candidatus Kerfeldbacteria bacterium RIFOXYB2_FULL_38_14]OGY89114.1 MAG: hypothetical protein A2458_02545 [Candidatus Kerfeldbacteria bacterium RIFOXYC2_FULL_38_9]
MSTSAKNRSKLRLSLYLILGFIALFLFLSLGSYWLVYQNNGTSAIKSALKNTLPYPAAIVNGQFVALKDLEKRVSGFNLVYQIKEDQGTPLTASRPSWEELRSTELEKMIDLKIIEQRADKYQVTVSDQDVQNIFEQEILPQAPNGEAEVVQNLKDYYGWTITEFKKYVLYEVILREKVAAKLSADAEITQSAKEKADAVYQEVLSGAKPFSEYATEYSDDSASAENGGELGFFGKGEMVQEFETVAFALNIGDVSQPVKTQYGYHIIKVTDKDESAGTVEARHILIAFDSLEKVVANKKAQASILRLLPKL